MADSNVLTQEIFDTTMSTLQADQALRDQEQRVDIDAAKATADEALAKAIANEGVNNLDSEQIAALQTLTSQLTEADIDISGLVSVNATTLTEHGTRLTGHDTRITAVETAAADSTTQLESVLSRTATLESGAEATSASVTAINAKFAYAEANKDAIVAENLAAFRGAYNTALAAA